MIDLKKRDLEGDLAWQIRMSGLPTPERQYAAIPGRRHRFDFAWPNFRLLLDVQGGIFSGGKHGRGAGIMQDQEKLNLASIEGWHVMHVSVRHIDEGTVILWLRRYFEKRAVDA